jgi:DNA-directed RNA polymerase subunit K/omega
MADFVDETLSDVDSEVGSVMSDDEQETKTNGFKIEDKVKKVDEDDEDYEEKDEEDDDLSLSDFDNDEEKDDVSVDNAIDDLDQQNEFNDDLDDGIDEDDDDEDEEEDYLKKFDENLQQNIIQEHHPELRAQNYEEIEALCTIVKNAKGNIVDPLHKTIPFISKYEKARVLGERAKQLDAGANSFIEDLDPTIMDGYLIALKEFEMKKIPFIIQRPLPNGACEYWRLKDLECLA